ncbi:dihydroorotate dehydrogenase (quinone) [Planococcus citri]|uniref:dihydroorotate dehydrogenase (quinone) n=1 Tax=Planococcus citri TaxID=170843 RepID=UPI0031F90D89
MGQSKRFWRIVAGASAFTFGTAATSLYILSEGHTEKFYNRFILPVLHRMDPELSHKVAIFAMNALFFPPSRYADPVSLRSQIEHLKFDNPVGLAAGFDKNGETLYNLLQFGFGFIEIGSITPLPQEGNKKPRVFRLPEDKAIINRYGFNSDGHSRVHMNLRIQDGRQDFNNATLGVNLGMNKNSKDPIDDYVKGVRRFAEFASYYVINLSSPNTPGLRDLQRRQELEKVLSAVVKARNEIWLECKPLLFLKLSPDLTTEEKADIASVIALDHCKIDGLIISNTTVQRDRTLKSPNKKEYGGLSGLPLKQRSTEMIAEMYKLTKGTVPIIGVGGIFTGEDAFEKIKAGASLVQIYTSFVYHGAPIVTKIKEELVECLKRENYSSISEAVGKGVEL